MIIDKQIIRKRGTFLFINILTLIMLFSLPLLLTPRHESLTLDRYIGFCVPLFAYLIVFYVNYLGLIKKYLFKKKFLSYFLSNVFLIVVLAVLLSFWNEYYFTNFVFDNVRKGPPILHFGFIFKDLLFMILTDSLAVAMKMTVEWYRTEKERAKIEVVASEAELKNLKNQLNPHFLFNTLNNIYSLMATDSAKAQNAILGLSKILRYVLYDDNQNWVSLEKELSFTKNYIELMSLRLTDNVALKADIQNECEGYMIAPLMFISLVENAFKHGVSQEKPSFIDINIFLENNFVKCIVKNSYFPKTEQDYSGSGIGVENLQRRLSLIYPEKHTFSKMLINDSEYIAELSITLD
ncbi:MAG: sensor histidine kinase [Bacteroidales bacterium]